MMSHKITSALCLAGLTFLTGCGSSDQDELRQWMTDQRNQMRSRVERLPEPTKFTPEAYAQEGSTEPFSNQKLAQALDHPPV